MSIFASRVLEHAQLDLGDRLDVLLVERVEDDGLVDPVQELGPEVLLDLAQTASLIACVAAGRPSA
jgi:hypothetical protein